MIESSKKSNEKIKEKRRQKYVESRMCGVECGDPKPLLEFTREAARKANVGMCDNKKYHNKGGHAKGDICDCFSLCNVHAEQRVHKKTNKQKEQNDDQNKKRCNITGKMEPIESFRRVALRDAKIGACPHNHMKGHLCDCFKSCKLHYEQKKAKLQTFKRQRTLSNSNKELININSSFSSLTIQHFDSPKEKEDLFSTLLNNNAQSVFSKQKKQDEIDMYPLLELASLSSSSSPIVMTTTTNVVEKNENDIQLLDNIDTPPPPIIDDLLESNALVQQAFSVFENMNFTDAYHTLLLIKTKDYRNLELFLNSLSFPLSSSPSSPPLIIDVIESDDDNNETVISNSTTTLSHPIYDQRSRHKQRIMNAHQIYNPTTMADRTCQQFNNEILVKGLKRSDMQLLREGKWLNDELINFYLSLLDRSCKCRIYVHNTFFYSVKLFKEGIFNYKSVKKWIDIDIFTQIDKILIPVHVGENHWALAVVNIRDKQFEYYDSIQNPVNSTLVVSVLRLYTINEAIRLGHFSRVYEIENWHSKTKTTPQQNNGVDCGMFVLQFARCVALDKKSFDFSQRDMSFLRQLVTIEMLEQRIFISKRIDILENSLQMKKKKKISLNHSQTVE